MNILVSNDDGYLAAGLRHLATALASFGEVTVVAPDRNRSGASNSLTLETPLRVKLSDNGYYRVDGTPTDCVHLAITGLLKEEPDIVVSGINHGANLGDDVIYSGTVAGAMEGRFLGLPSLAVSINSFEPHHLDSAAQAVVHLVKRLVEQPLDWNMILNVNVPDLPWDEIKGFKATRLGHRHKAEPVVKSSDPRGESIYWVGAPGPEEDAGEGTDFHAVRTGYISVTPIQIDLTQHAKLQKTSEWLDSGQ
ncbi:MAG TPA: 5'/3'-nucleotidase SurE [Gammaproteobacteria bacterium]|jgi:5'-nucleotidase|nr:5'/3'-nucleotidase SurE [Gammaproteobacteria bacterium]